MSRRKGIRKKTRSKFSKKACEHGKISFTKYFQVLNPGDIVCLKADPSVHEGLYYPRFHGKHAVVKGKKGGCYEVLIKDGNKEKILIVHPIHLQKA